MADIARRLDWATVLLTASLLVQGDGHQRYLEDGVGSRNVVALLGSKVQLNCSDMSSVTTSPIWRKTMPHGTAVNISNAVDKYEIKYYRLIIFSVSYNDSGIYTCDIPGSNETSEVHVTVLAANPTCFMDTSTAENDSIVLTSQLIYSGLAEPEMRWLQLPGKTETTCTDGRCISTIRLAAARWMDGVSAVCRTTVPSSISDIAQDHENCTDSYGLAQSGCGDHNQREHAAYVHSCDIVMSVQYSPSNVSIFPREKGTHRVSLGDKLICRSRANPPAKYRWSVYTKYGKHVMFHDGTNLAIKQPMNGQFLATCTAWNRIRGQKFQTATTADVKIVYVGVTGMVLGIGTGVTFCLLPWLLVFYMFRHEKKINSEHENCYCQLSQDCTKQASLNHEDEIAVNRQTDANKHNKTSFCYGNEAYVTDMNTTPGPDQSKVALGENEANTRL